MRTPGLRLGPTRFQVGRCTIRPNLALGLVCLFVYLFIIMYSKITSNAWNEVQHKKNSKSTKNKNILTNKNKVKHNTN